MSYVITIDIWQSLYYELIAMKSAKALVNIWRQHAAWIWGYLKCIFIRYWRWIRYLPTYPAKTDYSSVKNLSVSFPYIQCGIIDFCLYRTNELWAFLSVGKRISQHAKEWRKWKKGRGVTRVNRVNFAPQDLLGLKLLEITW